MERQRVTTKRSLTQATEDLLNRQIAMEGQSSAAYLSMASWCEMTGYENSSQFLYMHSEEERMHMLKLFHYVNEAGGHSIQAEIKDIQHNFTSLREVFESILQHEIAVTNSINEIVNHCYEIKDFTTMNFLNWFVEEQREEETIARRAVELFDLIGEDGVGLWTIDKEILALGQAAQAGNAKA